MRTRYLCFITLLAVFARPGAALAQQPTPTNEYAKVVVEWTTESETDLAGFNLYRSDDPQGPYIKVNDALIPASSDPVAGGSYAYTDTTVTAGVTYYYKLEDVELDGTSTMHGPIEVVAETDMGLPGLDASSGVVLALLAGLLLSAALILVARRRVSRAVSSGSSVEPGQ